MHDATLGSRHAPRGDDTHYDVCFSFAGEQRQYVDRVAEVARSAGIRVFYDLYERVELWGKDLYQHLDGVYSDASKFCVVFLSADYARKLWTSHELKSAQARAFRQHEEYLLPARFDDTRIPGIRDTVGYIDLRQTTPEQFGALIVAKVRGQSTDQVPVARSDPQAVDGEWVATYVAAGLAAAVTGFLAWMQHSLEVTTASTVGSLAVSAALAAAACGGIGWYTLARQAGDRPRYARWYTAVAVVVGLAVGGLAGHALRPSNDGPPRTYTEFAGNRIGSPLFKDPGSTPDGRRIPYGTAVEIDCKVPDASGMASVSNWYHIVSDPYRGLYAPSDTFANGDPLGGGVTAVDARVPDCVDR
ncbi:toll/interleukin-1 receptor domain-containing protein [Micromonospora sp. NPDC051227]|uniref:toll/interleukin-1 receptor domain-containing protein n=1 Tax=Micromonospora sp. NPDC051227 TaxID=3364285 RepID=UPI0037B9376A